MDQFIVAKSVHYLSLEYSERAKGIGCVRRTTANHFIAFLYFPASKRKWKLLYTFIRFSDCRVRVPFQNWANAVDVIHVHILVYFLLLSPRRSPPNSDVRILMALYSAFNSTFHVRKKIILSSESILISSDIFTVASCRICSSSFSVFSPEHCPQVTAN